MKRKGLMTVCVALVMMVFGITTAMAGPFGMHGKRGCRAMGGEGPGFHRLLGKLDLSDSQKTEVSQIMESYRSQMETAFENTRESRHDLMDIVANKPFNEDTIQDIQDAYIPVAAGGEAMVLLRAEIFSKIKAVLTTEQIEQLQTLRAERQARFETRLAERKAMMKNWLDE
ncbi:MAG: Spy/CpxP family protein refolding chaperone [Deltaproteobacteria bacterium]|nr:Spy/CpxP family protein refolding chaperone [Deltaproteobacteria bacterium]